MRRFLVPAIILAICLAGFLALVAGTVSILPDKVASHFGGSGEPDGWMSKSGFLTFMVLFGLGMPLLVTALTGACTFLPRWMVNLPNKDYWLSPAMQSGTRWYLVGQALWLDCLLVLMIGAIHYLTVVAHRSDPVRLPMTAFYVVLAVFLLLVFAWSWLVVRRFKRL
jgi:uncharacterized membrane protein